MKKIIIIFLLQSVPIDPAAYTPPESQELAVKVLATSADGVPFKFTDALDISSDGTIYFTDASSKYGQNEYLFDLLEAKLHGRFLSYDPATGQIKVILENLYFANGAALSQQENTLRRSLPLANMGVISIWAVYITIGLENINCLNALLKCIYYCLFYLDW